MQIAYRLKKFLREAKLTKNLYTRLYRIKSHHADKKSMAALQSHGGIVLTDLKDVFAQLGVRWYLAYGTCLGALRNHQFIGHDTDMDFYILPAPGADLAAVNKELAMRGFTHQHDYLVGGIPVESSWGRGAIHFDLFVLEEKDEGFGAYLFNRFTDHTYTAENEYSTSLSKAPHPTGTRMIDLAQVTVPIPANAEEYMEMYYGKNWRIPDPSYTWKDALKSRVLTDKIAIVKLYS